MSITLKELATINRSELSRRLHINVSNVSRILTRNPDQRRVPQLHTFYQLSLELSDMTGRKITLDELYHALYMAKPPAGPPPVPPQCQPL